MTKKDYIKRFVEWFRNDNPLSREDIIMIDILPDPVYIELDGKRWVILKSNFSGLIVYKTNGMNIEPIDNYSSVLVSFSNNELTFVYNLNKNPGSWTSMDSKELLRLDSKELLRLAQEVNDLPQSSSIKDQLPRPVIDTIDSLFKRYQNLSSLR